MKAFVLLTFLLCLGAISWRYTGLKTRRLIARHVKRNWWIPATVFLAIGSLLYVLSIFSIKTF